MRIHEQRYQEFAAGYEAPTVTTLVPVHFHVINRGAGLPNGDVPDSQIQAQMAGLNSAFAAHGFEFALAGITRTTHAVWFQMVKDTPEELEAKTTLHIGDRGTLNVYSAGIFETNPGFGWATFAMDVAGQPLQDGVVVDYRSLPGGAFQGFNEGDTAVHEVGHWLGLYHTHQGGCTEPNDHIEDTPATQVILGCPQDRDSCPALPGLDPQHNFMSYSDDPCMTEFTLGQRTRMAVQYALYRAPAVPLACGSACGPAQGCQTLCRRPDGVDTSCGTWGCCSGNCTGNPQCPGGSGGLAPYCTDGCGIGRPCDKLCRRPDGTCSTCGLWGCCVTGCGGGGGCPGGSGGLAPYCWDGCTPTKPCDKRCRDAEENCITCGQWGVCQQSWSEGALAGEGGGVCR